MGAPRDKSVVSPIMVGRVDYVDSLRRDLDAAREGGGRTATLAGEAGIGKSRLADETRASALERGFFIVQGNCFEPDATLPYAPLLDLLRVCMRGRSPTEIAEGLGADAADIARMMPEIASLVPGLALAPPLEPEQEKRRIFQALTQFFARLADRQPLLIVVEDVHWIDDTSLEFLLVLARRLPTMRALLLLTYRSDEVQASLGRTLTRMQRERLVSEYALRPLSATDVDAMIRAIFEQTTPTRHEFLDPIMSLTEGNPFFIEEILKSLVAAGGIFYADGTWERKPIGELDIPRSVHDAVHQRAEQLSADSRQILTTAAVTGRRFDFALLQRVTGRDEDGLVGVIKEMISAQLVVEEQGDRFSFRHALTQHVIASGLLAREQRSLHRTIGEHMRQLYAGAIEPHLADLAHHFYEGAAWDEAYYYCRRVGENAQKLYASRAAVEHFSRAIEAARHLGVAPPARLYRARGQSYELLGEFERAREDGEQALTAARGANDGAAEWQALIDLGFLWAGRNYRRTGEFFERATELARKLERPELIAQSLNRYGNWLVNTGAAEEGLRAHRDALHLFEQAGDTGGRADTLDLIGMGSGIRGDIVGCLEAVEQAVELYRSLDDNRGLVSTLSSRGTYSSPTMCDVSHSAFRTLDQCRVDTGEALRVAQRIGWPAGQAFAHFTASAAAAGFGEFGEAIHHGNESLRVATEIEHEQWVCGAHYTLGQIYVLLHAPDLAIHHLQEALPIANRLGSAWWIGNVSSYLALAHLQANDPRNAHAVLDASLPEGTLPTNMAGRRMYWARGEVALHEGDAAAALAIAEHLIDTTRRSLRCGA
jgi:tetratricopeptide (TPR) repeat protein